MGVLYCLNKRRLNPSCSCSSIHGLLNKKTQNAIINHKFNAVRFKLPLELGMSSPTLAGSLFVEYDAASGDVNVGAATTQGAAMPTVSGTFNGIQNQWNGGDLLTSFFIRSDGAGWQSGTAEAVFSNFRVIEGSATSVPEPSALSSFAVCGAFIVQSICRGRRKRHATVTTN